MAKKLLSALLSFVLLTSSALVSNAAVIDHASTAVSTPSTIASQALDVKYGYNEGDLGATYTPESTTFKVWAPTATKIDLNLFATGSDKEEGAADLGVYSLEKEMKDGAFTGVWVKKVDGDLKNVYYTYTVTSYKVTDFDIETETPIEGAEPTTVETQDVYSVATGVNSARSMVCDIDDTDPDGWENDTHVLLDKSTQSTVWEVHVKDFTFSKTSGVSDANRGKYLGFTEQGTTLNGEGNIATCIDHLKDLGVTTVQILPFYDYGSVDEAGNLDEQFNWGYDPMNYNVPEGSYSSNPYDGNVRIKECKQMIQALHKAGISVVMDVVYNHTYSYNSCFEAVVPNYYYRMKADGSYSNGSGCGNETASEHLMYRNFIVQSVLHWVNEYHVDGFRFDLMGIMDVETMNIIREELDKIDSRITMWGEGWTGGGCSYADTTCTGEKLIPATQSNAKHLNPRVAFFNDGIRDSIKGKALNAEDIGWVQGGGALRAGVRQGIVANTQGGNWVSQAPSQCVTYTSCHDNTTLWDKLCDTHGHTSDYAFRYEEIVAENKLAAAISQMSQGINFIHAGEEMGRTKHGDHNSYSSSPQVNMIDWNLLVSNADIVSYYKGLLSIRNNFDVITDDSIESSSNFTPKQVNAPTTVTYLAHNNTEGQWDKMVLLYNNATVEKEFELSDPSTTDTEWVIIANNEIAGLKKLGEVKNNVFTIPARGAIIAVDKESFEAVNLESNTGTVIVEHIDTVENKVMDRFVVTDEVGKYYETTTSKAVSNIFKLAEIEGETKGHITSDTQNIKYYYDYYVPETLDLDPNSDGKLDINDVTYLQRALAQVIEVSEEVLEKANCNYDDVFDVNDITMLQKHITGQSVSIGKVIVNYYKLDENGNPTDEKVCKSLEYSDRIGQEYTAEPAKALGFKLNETLLPDNSTVKVAGVPKEINYYYDYIGSKVNIYVKHSADLTWAPTIWIWGQKNGQDSGTNYCQTSKWPGDTLTIGEDGWYATSFDGIPTDHAYNVIISNEGGGQSDDCKGFVQGNLWIVIDDMYSDSSTSLLFYDVNPDTNPDAKPIYESYK